MLNAVVGASVVLVHGLEPAASRTWDVSGLHSESGAWDRAGKSAGSMIRRTGGTPGIIVSMWDEVNVDGRRWRAQGWEACCGSNARQEEEVAHCMPRGAFGPGCCAGSVDGASVVGHSDSSDAYKPKLIKSQLVSQSVVHMVMVMVIFSALVRSHQSTSPVASASCVPRG